MEPIDLRPKKERSEEYPISPANPGDNCPTVYLYGSDALADLPKEGTITFKYKRTELSLRDHSDRPVTCMLSLKEIVDATEESDDSEEESDDSSDDSGDSLDKKLKAAIGDSADEEIED
jgi:hypothetical protein